MKVGDWVICDCRICQVQEVEDGRVTEVSDGCITHSGNSLDCRPLTLANKSITERIVGYEDRLNGLPGRNALNWPDIHRFFERLVMDAIDYCTTSDKRPDAFYDKAAKFFEAVKNKLQDVDEVDGIRIFR
jgi:hypothetical protein